MSRVSGKLCQVVRTTTDGSAPPELGKVEFALCGYGPRIPRTTKPNSQFALITEAVAVANDGTFSVTLAGNDLIDPGGTYYTYTVKDANGDIVQCAAYLFADAQDYDLNWGTIPFDPSQGPTPSPVPPAITNELLILPAAFDMVFDGSTYTSFKTTLPGNVNAATIQNMNPGNLYTFIIVQDGAGGHLFNWPSGTHNATAVSRRPNGITIQTFVADYDGSLYAIAPGTYL